MFSILYCEIDSDFIDSHFANLQKINNKNSWSLDLIDHMGNLIKGDATGARGVNFQKVTIVSKNDAILGRLDINRCLIIFNTGKLHPGNIGEDLFLSS